MYKRQRKQSDKYLKSFQEIILKASPKLVNVRVSDEYKDTKESTDMIIEVLKSDIALRVREPQYDYRDLTIRTKALNGGKTEIDKLREGFADIYIYGWGDGKGKVLEYVMIDIDKLRQNDLLDDSKPTRNPDGTEFIAIDLHLLFYHKCIIDFELSEKTQESVRKKWDAMFRRMKRYGKM